MGCMVMAAIRHSGLQRRRLAPRLLDDLPTLLSLALVGLGAVLLLRGILHHTGGTNSVRDAAHLMAFLILFRLAMYTVVRWGRQRGYFLHKTLFIGHGKLGQVLSETLRDDRRYGLLPVGFVGDRPGESVTLPRLGTLSAVPELVRKHSIDAVVIADVEGFEERLTAATRSFDGKGVAVLLVPRLWELHGSVRGCEMIRGIPLVRLRRPAYESLTWPLKRRWIWPSPPLHSSCCLPCCWPAPCSCVASRPRNHLSSGTNGAQWPALRSVQVPEFASRQR